MGELYENLHTVMKSYPPLSYEEQWDLIKEAQEGNEDSKELLILSNFRLINKIISEYEPPSLFTKNDLFTEGVIALTEAIDEFDESKKGNLFIYYSEKIKWRIQNFIVRESYHESKMESYNESIYGVEDDDIKVEKIDRIADKRDQYHEFELIEDTKTYLSYVPPEEQIIVILAYGVLGFSQYSREEIGKLAECDAKTVTQKRKKAIQRMKRAHGPSGPIVKDGVFPPMYGLIDLDKLRQLITELGLIDKKESVELRKTKK